jgi:hypothetical protein
MAQAVLVAIEPAPTPPTAAREPAAMRSGYRATRMIKTRPDPRSRNRNVGARILLSRSLCKRPYLSPRPIVAFGAPGARSGFAEAPHRGSANGSAAKIVDDDHSASGSIHSDQVHRYRAPDTRVPPTWRDPRKPWRSRCAWLGDRDVKLRGTCATLDRP